MDNLQTFKGWMAAVHELLKDKPNWTGLDQGDLGYMVIIGGIVFAAPGEPEGHVYSEDELCDPCPSAWDDVRGCWDCGDPESDRRTILEPVFVSLAHA